jgi:hypothetical protein
MKTVALLFSAMMALAWICVFGGSTPLASRAMMDFGKVRSCSLVSLPVQRFQGH